MANEILQTFSNMGFKFDASSVGNIMLIISITVLVLIIVGALLYFLWLEPRQWNKTIRLWKKYKGKAHHIGTFKAKLVRFSLAGDFLIEVKGIKKFLTKPRYESENNLYDYYEREDGEWINFYWKELDSEMKTMGAFYEDKDLRFQRIAIQDLLKNRHQQDTFWSKYGFWIMFGLVFLILVVSLIILFHQFNKVVEGLARLSNSLGSISKSMDLILQKSTSGAIPI